MNDMIESASIKDKAMRLLGMDDEERVRQQEAAFAQMAQAMLSTMNSALNELSQQVAQQMGQISQQMAQHISRQSVMLQQMSAMNKQMMAESMKPSVVRIQSVQTDESGKIIGGTVLTNQMTAQ
jgi:adenylosuccinate synthase